MNANQGRAPERERDGQAMPDRSGATPGNGMFVHQAVRSAADIHRHPRQEAVLSAPRSAAAGSADVIAMPCRAIETAADIHGDIGSTDPTVLLIPARHHPGFIVLFRADDGRVHAGRVPETCPVEAMAHARRAFRAKPSTRAPGRPSPASTGQVPPIAGG